MNIYIYIYIIKTHKRNSPQGYAYFDGLDLADTAQTPTWANDMRRSLNMFKWSIF